MKRKRRWIVAYRCNKFGMSILCRLSFCKAECKDKKCVGCSDRGNEDLLNERDHIAKKNRGER
jgi:hypothetical protein